MKTSHAIDKRRQGAAPEASPPDTTPEPFLKWTYEFNEKTGKQEFKSIELSDGSKLDKDNLQGALKRATGAN
jgi:hypothetical protein